MRVVLDTNVIVSAVLIRRGNERHILEAWRGGAFDLVLSPPRIRDVRWTTDAEVVELLEVLAGDSIVVEGRLDVRASRDPTDDMFLAAAVEGEADYLVTGDRDLLVLESYRRVKIMRPAGFLRALSRQSRE